MNFYLLIPLVLFLITYGSMMLEGENKDKHSTKPTWTTGLLLDYFFIIISCVFNILIVSNLLDIAWYWCVLIMIPVTFISGVFLADIYASFLGRKAQPQLNQKNGMYEKYNLYRLNGIITFLLGVILFFLLR